MRCKRMHIGNEEKARMLMLHSDKIPDCTEVISYVKISGTPDTANNRVHAAKLIENGTALLADVSSHQLNDKFLVFNTFAQLRDLFLLLLNGMSQLF